MNDKEKFVNEFINLLARYKLVNPSYTIKELNLKMIGGEDPLFSVEYQINKLDEFKPPMPQIPKGTVKGGEDVGKNKRDDRSDGTPRGKEAKS